MDILVHTQQVRLQQWKHDCHHGHIGARQFQRQILFSQPPVRSLLLKDHCGSISPPLHHSTQLRLLANLSNVPTATIQ